MKTLQYKATTLWTRDRGYIGPNPTDPFGTYPVVMAADYDALEKRHQEALKLLGRIWNQLQLQLWQIEHPADDTAASSCLEDIDSFFDKEEQHEQMD